MRFRIKTLVKKPFKEVFEAFNRDLFLKLNPPFPFVRLLQFDGCKKQDKVALELNFIFFKSIWESLISENTENKEEIYFVDEGIRLPFFLKYWKHKHLIQRENNASSTITDDISFKTPFLLSDYLLFPLLYLQFLYRKPIYRKVFK